MTIKGFKPTGYGMKSGFHFSSSQGFTGSTGSVTNVSPYVRRKGYANGGIVKEGYQPKIEKVGDSGHATTLRNKPSTNLDQEAGGRSPLRPGFRKGGHARKAMGGGIGALRSALSAAVGKAKQQGPMPRPAQSPSPRVTPVGPPRMIKRADGGPVGNKFMVIRSTSDKLSQKEKEAKRSEDSVTARGYRKAIEHNLSEYKRESNPRIRRVIQEANDIGFGVPNHTPNFNKTRDFKPKRNPRYGDGGRIGGVTRFVKSVMGKMKAPEKVLPPPPSAQAPKSEAKAYAYVDRRSGERRSYANPHLRDAALDRRRKLEGVAFFDPIDSSSQTTKRRGGPVKMPRC